MLERRLDRAWQRLVTAEAATLAISAVAYEVGFGGLSYFNRCFRKRFGRPPSQIKALASAARPGPRHPLAGAWGRLEDSTRLPAGSVL